MSHPRPKVCRRSLSCVSLSYSSRLTLVPLRRLDCLLFATVIRPLHQPQRCRTVCSKLSAMQAQLMDPNDQPKSSWNGFNDLPAELRNQIYHYRTVFNNSNGDRRIFTVKEFRIRYQLHISLLRASSEIAKELKPIILGSHTLHLKVNRNYGSSLFANDQWDIISYTRRSDVLHSTHMEVPPSKLRPFSEHLKITLEAPMETKEEVGKQLKRKLQDSERAWSVSEDDWLYPRSRAQSYWFRESRGVGNRGKVSASNSQ